MNRPAVQRWVAALRSGKYEQTVDALHDSGGYCCLGVACELFADEAGVERQDHYSSFQPDLFISTEWDGEQGELPTKLVKFLGLRSAAGSINQGSSLASLNDSGKSFAEIADIIEAEPGLWA